MAPLPRQLEWRQFETARRKLGYKLDYEGPGSAITYFHPSREPRHPTFHKPHRPKTIKPGTLRAYVRQLGLGVDEFLKLIE